jgi:hypothetical protein
MADMRRAVVLKSMEHRSNQELVELLHDIAHNLNAERRRLAARYVATAARRLESMARRLGEP